MNNERILEIENMFESNTIEIAKDVAFLSDISSYVIIDFDKFEQELSYDDLDSYEQDCYAKTFEEICEDNDLNKDKYIVKYL